MRWKEPEIGEERVVKRFLLLPKMINKETRWLEWVYIKQIYCLIWMDDAWADKQYIDKRHIQKSIRENSISVNLTNKPFPGPPPKQPKRR